MKFKNKAKYMLISKIIVITHKIYTYDNKGYWEIDVYDSGLNEISEQEMYWNLQEQFF